MRIVTLGILWMHILVGGCGVSDLESTSEPILGKGGLWVKFNQIPSNLASLTLTMTAPDIETPISFSMAITDEEREIRLDGIPAGSNRSILAEGLDSEGSIIARGSSDGIEIAPNTTTQITLILEILSESVATGNLSLALQFETRPKILGLLIHPVPAMISEPISLGVDTTTDDPTQILTYLWEASAGSFEDPTVQYPIWIAPSNESDVSIRVTVSNDHLSTQFSTTISVVASFAPTPQPGDIVLNEFLADPGDALTGDSNEDGVSNSNDEFIEIVNTSTTALNLSGTTIEDSLSVRHHFEELTLLEASKALVIFGNGNGIQHPYSYQSASAGTLSLNNTGDIIRMRSSFGEILFETTYGSEANENSSITRNPDISGSFVNHDEASSHQYLFSPGTRILGEAF